MYQRAYNAAVGYQRASSSNTVGGSTLIDKGSALKHEGCARYFTEFTTHHFYLGAACFGYVIFYTHYINKAESQTNTLT